jgi:hypothetical protein
LTAKVDELTNIVEKVSSSQPGGTSHSDDLKKITEGTRQIQGQVRQNELVLQNVGKSISTIKSAFPSE